MGPVLQSYFNKIRVGDINYNPIPFFSKESLNILYNGSKKMVDKTSIKIFGTDRKDFIKLFETHKLKDTVDYKVLQDMTDDEFTHYFAQELENNTYINQLKKFEGNDIEIDKSNLSNRGFISNTKDIQIITKNKNNLEKKDLVNIEKNSNFALSNKGYKNVYSDQVDILSSEKLSYQEWNELPDEEQEIFKNCYL